MTHVDIPQSICRAGVARRDVTPPVGIYHRMWGAATHDRATGIHRPLTATALALAPAGEPPRPEDLQVVLAVDHCLLWNREMDALLAAAAGVSELRVDQLHIAFSHTHGAGLMDPRRADLPGGEWIADYLAALARSVGEAAAEAIRDLRDATIVYGKGRSNLARNRDFHDEAADQFVCGFNPDGPSDDTLLVARVHDRQGDTLATVVNYACHPTTLAWDNTLISPDYVGAMRDVIECTTLAPCLFLQGASGDLGPREGFVGDAAVADRNGRQLGYAALATLESLDPPGTAYEYAGAVVSGATIGVWRHRKLADSERARRRRWTCQTIDVSLEYRADLPLRGQTEAQLQRLQREERAARESGDLDRARLLRAHVERMTRQLSRLDGVRDGEPLSLAVRLMRLGDAVWILLAGEHYHWLQTSLRARFPRTPIVVSTVTGGWSPGYLPTAETYGRGIYQESIALAAPGSLELLAERIGEALAELP
jgi:hypothetical protein